MSASALPQASERRHNRKPDYSAARKEFWQRKMREAERAKILDELGYFGSGQMWKGI